MRAPTKWESVLDRRPVPLRTHLIEQLAPLLGKQLLTWPPDLEFEPETASELPQHRPGLEIYAAAFRLARWEIEREFDAVDHYFRHSLYRDAGLGPSDKPTLLLLARWMVEQLLSLGEATEHRIDRPAMRTLLEKTEAWVLNTGQKAL